MESDLDPSKITYPRMWTYAVIGWDEEDLRLAIAAIVRGRKYRADFSRKSAAGKYSAMHLELMVLNEADRNEIFVALQKHPKVKLVI